MFPKAFQCLQPAPENLAKTVDAAFERRDEIGPKTEGDVRKAVEQALDLLDRGAVRVAERTDEGTWRVNQWLKKAVLLSFRLSDMSEIGGGPGHAGWSNEVPSRFDRWDESRLRAAGFARCRAVWSAARLSSRRA